MPETKPETQPGTKPETKPGTARNGKAPGKAARAAKPARAAAGEAAAPAPAAVPGPLAVLKTYKLYLGGAFPRSESGRTYAVTDHTGRWLANAPLASRKDARDAVVAARRAFPRWSGATAYLRGQILYRIAEMLQSRGEQFAAEVAAAEGVTTEEAARLVAATIDRWVWYAGWTDKITQIGGGANPVAGPYFNLSTPEPTGVVAVLAPRDSALLGLVSVLAPVLATGNTAVLVTSHPRPLPALTLAEVLATSDLPAGVVNILSGDPAELGPPLAAHQDVNALDLTGAAPDEARDLEVAAAHTLKRLHRPDPDEDWQAAPGLARLRSFLETKTVWHPKGI
ncbi:aldehyde dehydrogenase family protein [Streptomyces hoynatensis]|uniref:Aldehyde dehydrogenase family protein n=1 Tax=Streptomyces hoynatensis TaxID=1141874 RepID=A0A3A9YNP1_9ACTN|nr:aldehyde dehydrogenase family protein [Streptomyces hoynatensis]